MLRCIALIVQVGLVASFWIIILAVVLAAVVILWWHYPLCSRGCHFSGGYCFPLSLGSFNGIIYIMTRRWLSHSMI